MDELMWKNTWILNETPAQKEKFDIKCEMIVHTWPSSVQV